MDRLFRQAGLAGQWLEIEDQWVTKPDRSDVPEGVEFFESPPRPIYAAS